MDPQLALRRTRQHWILEAQSRATELIDKGRRQNNEGILRYAFKMATGPGKTKVMTMVLAYLVLVRKIKNVLVITPTLTIKHQLLHLKDQTREMVPRKYRDTIARLKLSVMNFQQFAPRDISGCADSPAKIHRQVIGVSDEDWLETTEQMMYRLLKGHVKSKKLVVINVT